jgi:hypothetical protein
MEGAWAYRSKTIPVVHGAMCGDVDSWSGGVLACKPIKNTQILRYTFTDYTHIDSIIICIYLEYMHFLYNFTCIEYIDQLDG